PLAWRDRVPLLITGCGLRAGRRVTEGDLKPHRRLVRHGVGTAAATRFPETAPLHPRRDDVPRRAGPVARGAPASGGHGRVVYAGVDIKSRRAVVELVPPAHDPGFRCAGRDIRARPYEEIIAL